MTSQKYHRADSRQQRFKCRYEHWASYVTLISICKPRPSHLWNGDNDSVYSWVAWKEILQGKPCKPLFMAPGVKWSLKNCDLPLLSLSEYYQSRISAWETWQEVYDCFRSHFTFCVHRSDVISMMPFTVEPIRSLRKRKKYEWEYIKEIGNSHSPPCSDKRVILLVWLVQNSVLSPMESF